MITALRDYVRLLRAIPMLTLSSHHQHPPPLSASRGRLLHDLPYKRQIRVIKRPLAGRMHCSTLAMQLPPRRPSCWSCSASRTIFPFVFFASLAGAIFSAYEVQQMIFSKNTVASVRIVLCFLDYMFIKIETIIIRYEVFVNIKEKRNIIIIKMSTTIVYYARHVAKENQLHRRK